MKAPVSLLLKIDPLPWGIVILLCATLGLAPFTPPHIVEKLSMLATGTLKRAIDWFDLLLHGFPWVLLALKALALAIKKGVAPRH